MNNFVLIGSILLTGIHVNQKQIYESGVYTNDSFNHSLIERDNSLYYEPGPENPDFNDPIFSPNSNFLEMYYRYLAINKPGNYFGICG